VRQTRGHAQNRVALDTLLRKFRGEDVEKPLAWFKTRVPSVGEHAFLNIIYKPVPEDLQAHAAQDLKLPAPIADFYRHYNGVRLFFDALNVYGLLVPGATQDRYDAFALLPFSLSEANAEFDSELRARDMVCIGSYGFDRSLVCISRKDESILCFVGTAFSTFRARWNSLSQWLSSEVFRIGTLFDEHGKLVFDEAATLPSSIHQWHG